MDKRFVIPGVGANTPLAEAAVALLRAKAQPLFELESSAAGGADMDAVHDMRVASRRLREAMRLLAPLYEKRRFDEWYGRIRNVTRALGPVRDSDVFIDYFARLETEVSDAARVATVFLVGYRMGRREQELARLNRDLRRLDLTASRKAFWKMASSVSNSAEAGRPFVDFAHAAVAERSAQVFGLQLAALIETNVPEQHALRIAYKRLRYAVEAFAPCYGEDFDELHETLTAFQDTLGELHDAHVFLEMVSSPDMLESAGRAGVPTEGIEEVEAALLERASRMFAHFVALAQEHPAQQLLPRLLLPLSLVPEAQGESEVVSQQECETVSQTEEPGSEQPRASSGAPGSETADADQSRADAPGTEAEGGREEPPDATAAPEEECGP